MEFVLRPHAKNMVRFAADKPEILVLSADLTSSCEADDFRDAYPERFFAFGLAEQNMIGFAAGLAREGFFPYVHTFAVFICRRPFDQVAMSIGYPNLPVRLIGFLPGVTTPGGATHQAVDDVALMRVIPNMTILECGDATDVESALEVAQAVDGPVYVRMLRGEVPRLFEQRQPMRINTARVLSEGRDVALLSTGICTEQAVRAQRALSRRGVSIRHLHISTIKPFDDPQILEAVENVRFGVIAVENHSVIGGLGSAVAEIMAERGVSKKLIRLGLKDVYAHGASRRYLMRKYGLDAPAITRAVEKLTDAKFNFNEDAFDNIEIAPQKTDAKAEDL
jgi:transketolase